MLEFATASPLGSFVTTGSSSLVQVQESMRPTLILIVDMLWSSLNCAARTEHQMTVNQWCHLLSCDSAADSTCEMTTQEVFLLFSRLIKQFNNSKSYYLSKDPEDSVPSFFNMKICSFLLSFVFCLINLFFQPWAQCWQYNVKLHN